MRSTCPRDSARLQPARGGLIWSFTTIPGVCMTASRLAAAGPQLGGEHGPSVLSMDLQLDLASAREDLLANGAIGAEILDQCAAHVGRQRGAIALGHRILVQIDHAVIVS